METDRSQLAFKTIRICMFLLLVSFLTRCTGPAGPMGHNGQDGLDGINYTRSVIYDVNPSEWTGDLNRYDAILDIPEITEDIYYDGAVLVYRLIEIDPISFNMLPYTYVDNSLTVYMDYDAYIGSIDLIYKEVVNGVNDTPAPEGTMSFKVVIIQGLPLAALKGMVDISDYEAVAKMLKIDKSGKNADTYRSRLK